MKKFINRSDTKNEKAGWLAKLALRSVRHAKISAIVWITIVIFGLLSYLMFMQRQGFPDVQVPISTVTGTYFANDKTKVDSEVVKPIVDLAQKDANVKKTTATALDNGFTIVVQYTDGTNATEASASLQKKVEQNLVLPSQAKIEYKAINASKFINEYDTLVAVRSNNLSQEQLENAALKYTSALNEKISPSSAVVISSFQTGISPATGQAVKQQKSFDFLATRANNQLSAIERSVVIGIKNPKGTDIIKFDDKLTKAINEFNGQARFSNIQGSVAADQAAAIKLQIHLLQDNLLEGLLIVAIVCMLFISWRAGIVAALGMVGTLTMTLAILYLLGISLNTITLFGLILCLGLIVDDTVIMAEAIDKYKDNSRSFAEAVKIAANHVAVASLSGTLVTILAFTPLLFVSGVLGEFIRILPITIIIALAVSLLASISLIPFLASKIDRHPQRDWRQTFGRFNPFRWVEQAISFAGSGIILWSDSRWRKTLVSTIAIGISIEFIILGGQFFNQLKFDIFPNTKDSDVISINADFAPGNSLEANQIISKKLNEVINNNIGPEVERISYNGSGSVRSAKVIIKLTPYDKRTPTAKELISQIKPGLNSLSGAKFTVSQVDAGPPKDSLPFKVQITAKNRVAANEAATKLSDYLKSHTLTRADRTVVTITEVEYDGARPILTRSNGETVVQVSAGFAAEDTTALVQLAQNDVKDFIANDANRGGLQVSDYRFDFGSESSNQDSFKTVLLAFPALLLAMYILIAIQFRSLTQPLLIFLAIPFSFFGVGLGLYLTNNPISFFVMVGFFALIGISLNNTILLTDFANQRRKLGDNPRVAIASALNTRVRPLLTTSTTAVVALIPLALSDPFWESLAVTLIFGVMSSAFLVIVAFPYYYLILESLRIRTSRLWRKLLPNKSIVS